MYFDLQNPILNPFCRSAREKSDNPEKTDIVIIAYDNEGKHEKSGILGEREHER